MEDWAALVREGRMSTSVTLGETTEAVTGVAPGTGGREAAAGTGGETGLGPEETAGGETEGQTVTAV